MKKILVERPNKTISIIEVDRDDAIIIRTVVSDGTLLPEELLDALPETPQYSWRYDAETGTLFSDLEVLNQIEWEKVRLKRSKLLFDSDVMVARVFEKGLDRTPLATYRQSLRDITLQPDPFNIDWPVIPHYDF